MKSAVVVLGLFAMIAVHVAANKTDMNKFIKMKDSCKEKSGITEEELKKRKMFEVPQTRNDQCYSACMQKEMGFVFPNNTINIAHIKEMKEKKSEYFEKLIKISEICATKDLGDTDECIAGKKIKQCFVEEADKIGFKMHEM